MVRLPTQTAAVEKIVTVEVPSSLTMAMVTRVIDDYTIEVRVGGRAYKVRYIGIDTPETVHPKRPVECYGPEASQRSRELVEGRTVFLEKDVSETDRYGRLLRYVWLEDGRMVNELLVFEGYAQAVAYPPDVKYADRLLQAQADAVEDGTGLWGLCTEQAPEESPDAGNCDPAYPTRRFTVLV